MQPHAPFGAYLGLSLEKGAPPPRTLPASPLLASDAFARERDAIAAARHALHAYLEGRHAEAAAGFEALQSSTTPVLDPARIGIGVALARFAGGEPALARAALTPSLDESVPVDVRIPALLLAARCADRVGQRADALAGYRAMLALVDAHPEWNVFDREAAQARAGMATPLSGEPPAVSHYVLRLPE
jgi:hypothetical protein